MWLWLWMCLCVLSYHCREDGHDKVGAEHVGLHLSRQDVRNTYPDRKKGKKVGSSIKNWCGGYIYILKTYMHTESRW